MKQNFISSQDTKQTCEFASPQTMVWSNNCCGSKAAHLAGVIAAHWHLARVGIPIKSSTLDGLDSLLSTVQMPKVYLLQR